MEPFTLAPFVTASLLTLATPTPSPDQAQIGVYELPAVSGLWQLAPSESRPVSDDCQERYNFGKNGQLKTVSGAEITYGQYAYVVQPEGLPILAMQTVHDNNAPDCSGAQVDQSGDVFSTFVSLDSRHDPTVMRWCSDSVGQKCHATLQRILP